MLSLIHGSPDIDGLAAGPNYQPKASTFDDLRMRLSNQLSDTSYLSLNPSGKSSFCGWLH